MHPTPSKWLAALDGGMLNGSSYGAARQSMHAPIAYGLGFPRQVPAFLPRSGPGSGKPFDSMGARFPYAHSTADAMQRGGTATAQLKMQLLNRGRSVWMGQLRLPIFRR
jgi:hypothetical protein